MKVSKAAAESEDIKNVFRRILKDAHGFWGADELARGLELNAFELDRTGERIPLLLAELTAVVQELELGITLRWSDNRWEFAIYRPRERK